jgi:hypothetical protein
MSSHEGHDIDVRYFGDIAGCYALSSRENLDERGVKVFACRVRTLSPYKAVLHAPVMGERGEAVALHLDDIGFLKASVHSGTEDGFVAELQLTAEQRQALAAKISWLKRRHAKVAIDRRESKRWPPRDPRSILILPGNKIMRCFVIDVSSSGVAVSADAMPEIGDRLAIGTLLGQVVRRMPHGFAVQFAALQDAAAVEGLLRSPEPKRRRAITKALASVAQTA